MFLWSIGETSERINQFKKWFWSVLEKFNAVERQDLVRKMKSDGLRLKLVFLPRFISGRVVQHYLPRKLVFNLNHRWLFVLSMINIYQQLIHVSVVCMFHCILRKTSSSWNFNMRSKPKCSVLYNEKADWQYFLYVRMCVLFLFIIRMCVILIVKKQTKHGLDKGDREMYQWTYLQITWPLSLWLQSIHTKRRSENYTFFMTSYSWKYFIFQFDT